MPNTSSKKAGSMEITGLKKKHELKDDPFLKEKKQRAIEFLKEHPIPEEILNHMKKKS